MKAFFVWVVPWHADEQDDHRDSDDKRKHGCRCQILLVVMIFNLAPEGTHVDLGVRLQVGLDNFRLEYVGGRMGLRLQLKKVFALGQLLYLEEVRERKREDRYDLEWLSSRLNLD